MEFSTEPISRRIAYIKRYKPKGEIATRLRLLKPVKGKLPKESKCTVKENALSARA